MRKSVQRRVLLRCFRSFPKSKCLELYGRMLVDENEDVVEVLPEVTKILIERGFIDGD